MKKRFWDQRLPIIKDIGGLSDEWDPCRQILEGHSSSVTAAVFSQNEKLLASTSYDGTLRVWDIATGVCVQSLEGHTNNVVALAFSPNGETVAAASDGHEVRLWDIALGLCRKSFPGHKERLTSLAFSPNGKLIVSTSYDDTARLWDIDAETVKVLDGHRSAVSSATFALPKGKMLASASYDDTIRLWNTATGINIKTVNFSSDAYLSLFIETIAFTPDTKAIISVSRDGTARRWDIDTMVGEQMLETGSHSSYDVAVSLEVGMVARGFDDYYRGVVELYDLASGHCKVTLRGHDDLIHSMRFSPTGKMLASASRDKKIRVWDVTASPSVQKSQSHTGRVACIAFSPDGKTVASASSDASVRTWDAATLNHKRTLRGHSSSATVVTFSPENNLVASASPDETVRIWDLTDGECIQVFHAHAWGLTFSPEGKYLATASSTNNIQVWDITEGNRVREFEGASCRYPYDHIPHEQRTSTVGVVESDDMSTPIVLIKNSVYEAVDWRSLFPGFEDDPRCRVDGLFVKGDWVIRGGKNILWLPPDYRPESTAIHDTVLVLGQVSGQITRLEFSQAGG
jgi:WD40 repeat protein